MRRLTMLLLALGALAIAAAVAVAAGVGDNPTQYPAKGDTYVGLRPTAVGLPQIGASGTTGAGELSSALRAYHDSGKYDQDLQAVGASAKNYLQKRLAERHKPPKACTVKFERKRVQGQGGPLYRKIRRCKALAQPTGKPAIVLDIDETALSNYSGLTASNFSGSGTAGPAVSGTGTAIAPTLDLYRFAKQNGVAVFFITGRPSAIQGPTESNLKNVGYDQGFDGLFFKPGDKGTQEFKSGQRAAIEAQGFYIYADVGDQESDLDGGHAERGFKMPNPFYFIAD